MTQDAVIYHFTHIDNIPNIIEAGGLFADGQTGDRMRVEVGDRAIKTRRRELAVPKGPGGVPADYVPFYFAPRSPMMLCIKSGRVPQYQEGQEPLIYLTSTARLMATQGIPYLFTDGNCASRFTTYYEDLSDLDQVDWAIMRAAIWKDTADDPDRKRRRMAEFLMHRFAPLQAISGMATMNTSMESRLQSILTEHGYAVDVKVQREWYYR
ncbi:type II toxin-antitoxin system toxin DNA ADP-ribosyl transferase DarT [Streptomyces rubrogriseus]|uniref:type II toxin-antitoxin system toxin DNA ADP-ribosyl transferase DarT n=1 Tax=Streptomyces rubrogriseus TaxID=194673 RepID=UPI0037D6AAE0